MYRYRSTLNATASMAVKTTPTTPCSVCATRKRSDSSLPSDDNEQRLLTSPDGVSWSRLHMTTTPVSTVHDTEPESLFERVGGDPAIRAVMEGFYARIMSDRELRPVFERVNIERHSRRAAAFVAAAAGGPHEWSGRDMATAHRHLRVTNEQFDRVAAHLNDTLEAMTVPTGLIGELLILVGSLRAQIVNEPVS